jgi:hypothetical protein
MAECNPFVNEWRVLTVQIMALQQDAARQGLIAPGAHAIYPSYIPAGVACPSRCDLDFLASRVRGLETAIELRNPATIIPPFAASGCP